MRTRIKICGVTTPEVAVAVEAAGADAMGLMFYPPSQRYISAKDAANLVSHVSPWLTKVGVFVNPSASEVKQVLSHVKLDYLQFHGEEDASFCQQFALPYIKAVRVVSAKDIIAAESNHPQASGLLLDAHSNSAYGGTGAKFDWGLCEAVQRQRLILAGGLNVQNVDQAILATQPFAVDVSSGVETNKAKDINKVNMFCNKVVEADFQLINGGATSAATT